MTRQRRQDKWLYFGEVYIQSSYESILTNARMTDRHDPVEFASYCRRLVAGHTAETKYHCRTDMDTQTAFSDVYGDAAATERQLDHFEHQCYKTAAKIQRQYFLDALQQTEPQVDINEKHYKALFKASHQQHLMGLNPAPLIRQLHTAFGVSHSSDQDIITHFLSSPSLQDIMMITSALGGHGAKKRHLIRLHRYISTQLKDSTAPIASIVRSLDTKLPAEGKAEKEVTYRQLIQLLNTVMPAPRQKRRANGKNSAHAQLAPAANEGKKKARQVHAASADSMPPKHDRPAL